MAVRNHGGGCCGMRHSSGYSLENDAQRIYEKIREDKQSRDSGRLIEVVVTHNQLASQPNLGPILRAEGFKHVNSFRNSNTRNVCHVFHFIEKDNLRRLPSIEELLAADAPPPPPPKSWKPVPRDYRPHTLPVRINAPRSRMHGHETTLSWFYRPGTTRYFYIGGLRFRWDQVEAFY